MNAATVLSEIRDLKLEWRNQSFIFTSEQQAKYDKLIELRHARVKELYETGRVYKSGANK